MNKVEASQPFFINLLGVFNRALLYGADEYMMKPFNPEVVQDKLRMLGF